MNIRTGFFLAICLIGLAGCSNPISSTATMTSTPGITPTLASTETPPPIASLTVKVLYPTTETEAEMGQSVKSIVEVTDTAGQVIRDAEVTITVYETDGAVAGVLPAVFGSGDVYRAGPLVIPHRAAPGRWTLAVEAKTDHAQGQDVSRLQVKNSTSEILLNKYGFWLDAPALRGIVPQLVAERGDAYNGLIRWGGSLPAQHVLPENWVEVQWRKGDFQLTTPAAVRAFVLDDLGDLGFTPVRDIGPFQPIQFKQWAGWQMEARGQFQHDQMEWVIFYAPETDETYAIATTVVLPPTGINPHAVLRTSFAVFPEVHAAGVAPEPLPKLLPGPELLSPPLGARFQGLKQPIVLEWTPIKELATDEYYEVSVDYNYDESNLGVKFATRQTQLTLPETLYQTPNCLVFNWQVTMKRQTGVDEKGRPIAEALSYNSLYWYVQWLHPSGETPFILKCPNPQF